MIGRGLCLALLVFAGPALAQTQVQPEQKAPPNKTAQADRKICERVEEMGSRLGTKKVCMTAKQWEEQRRSQADNIDPVLVKD